MIQNDFEKVKAAYLSKLKISRDAFLSGIAGMTPQELISNAHNIAGVQLCYKKLLKANEEEMLYLLQFRDPLMAVASGYTVMENDVAADDIFEIITTMQDDPDTFRQFPQGLPGKGRPVSNGNWLCTAHCRNQLLPQNLKVCLVSGIRFYHNFCFSPFPPFSKSLSPGFLI